MALKVGALEERIALALRSNVHRLEHVRSEAGPRGLVVGGLSTQHAGRRQREGQPSALPQQSVARPGKLRLGICGEGGAREHAARGLLIDSLELHDVAARRRRNGAIARRREHA